MANNELLFNAAVCGFVAGNMAGRSPSSETSGDYTNLVDAAEAFAAEVDANIAEDATISQAGGNALAPTTAAIQQAQVGKTCMMTSICMAITSGRYYTSETQADYENLADVVAAQYAAGIAALLTA
jgi:hypothetical protein